MIACTTYNFHLNLNIVNKYSLRDNLCITLTFFKTFYRGHIVKSYVVKYV